MIEKAAVVALFSTVFFIIAGLVSSVLDKIYGIWPGACEAISIIAYVGTIASLFVAAVCFVYSEVERIRELRRTQEELLITPYDLDRIVMKAISEGTNDVHAQAAVFMFGKKVEDITEEERQAAKIAVYRARYGHRGSPEQKT